MEVLHLKHVARIAGNGLQFRAGDRLTNSDSNNLHSRGMQCLCLSAEKVVFILAAMCGLGFLTITSF